MHYNWNRYYNPTIGRYTQEDPIGFAAGDENLYRYVANQVNKWADPTGLLFGINAGESYGEEAALYWANRYNNSDWWFESIYTGAMGLSASLWTECTSEKTVAALTFSYGVRNAGQVWKLADGSPARTIIDFGRFFRVEKHWIGSVKKRTRALKWHIDAFWGLMRHWPWKI
ncbi:hypothetical protein METP3_00150 [Methanosarcinales archaeon]|nr:hypothetical protein METP3_00150 [Methanosarcinales archaeon]